MEEFSLCTAKSMHSSKILKSSVIKTEAQVKAAANKTTGIYDPQLVILLKK
jgi:hypothetical protein